MKINRVICTIIPAREDFVGQVEEGFFTYEGDRVELVSHAGMPLRARSGKAFAKTLAPGEDAYQIAARLLKDHYNSKRDRKRFNRPLTYPRSSLV